MKLSLLAEKSVSHATWHIDARDASVQIARPTKPSFVSLPANFEAALADPYFLS
jgi:hypothetical protein